AHRPAARPADQRPGRRRRRHARRAAATATAATATATDATTDADIHRRRCRPGRGGTIRELLAMIRQNLIARAPRTVGALLLAATVLSVTACKKNDADAAPAKVETMLVGPENVSVVRSEQIRSGPAISGSLTPERSATIRAEMSGAVVQTFAEAGQRVSRGQQLAQIDAAVLRDQALSARSAVTTAQSSYDIA